MLDIIKTIGLNDYIVFCDHGENNVIILNFDPVKMFFMKTTTLNKRVILLITAGAMIDKNTGTAQNSINCYRSVIIINFGNY